MADETLTVGEVAKLCGAQDWQVRRSIDRAGIPVERKARMRLVSRSHLPQIKAELKRRGWLPDSAALNAG